MEFEWKEEKWGSNTRTIYWESRFSHSNFETMNMENIKWTNCWIQLTEISRPLFLNPSSSESVPDLPRQHWESNDSSPAGETKNLKSDMRSKNSCWCQTPGNATKRRTRGRDESQWIHSIHKQQHEKNMWNPSRKEGSSSLCRNHPQVPLEWSFEITFIKQTNNSANKHANKGIYHPYFHPQQRSHMQHNTHTIGVSPLNLLILMHIYKLKGQGRREHSHERHHSIRCVVQSFPFIYILFQHNNSHSLIKGIHIHQWCKNRCDEWSFFWNW